MKYKVIKPFIDKNTKEFVKFNNIVEFEDKRAAEINSAFGAPFIEEYDDEKSAAEKKVKAEKSAAEKKVNQ